MEGADKALWSAIITFGQYSEERTGTQRKMFGTPQRPKYWWILGNQMLKRSEWLEEDWHWMSGCMDGDIHGCWTVKTLKMAILATWEKYVLASAVWKARVGHKSMGQKKASLHGYFFIVNRSKEAKQYVCKVSHHYVFYTRSERRKMRDSFKMHTIELPSCGIASRRGYLLQAGAEHLNNHNLWYHLYTVPKGFRLKYSMAFAYKWRIGIAGSGGRSS